MLLMAALLTACSSEDKAQPDAASREQPKTWKLCIQANKIDSTATRGVHFEGDVLKSKWNENQPVEVYNESDELVGTLHAEASSNGSTTIAGDISGSYTANTSKLYLYSPSKTRDYSGQTGTIESMSAKDYVSAEITVTAVDGSSGVLATSTASFARLQSFTKFTFSEAVHQVVISAESMSDITVTAASGNQTEFYVALPLEGAKVYTFVGKTDTDVVYYGQKNGTLTHGRYYTASVDLLKDLEGTVSIGSWGDGGTLPGGNLIY